MDTRTDAPGGVSGGALGGGRAMPIGAGERIASLDVIRGVALLGIFAMNITSFALPFDVYMTPELLGPISAWDMAVYQFNHLLFENKMMALFSMLFGAGVFVFASRARAAGRSAAALHYRRTAWLILFGVLHGYLLWFGDILFFYGCCGLLLFLFWRLSARTLLVVAGGFLLMGVFISVGLGVLGMMFAPEGGGGGFGGASPAENAAAQALAIEGGYLSRVSQQAPITAMMQLIFGPLFMSWWLMGYMLIGMALLKLGVLSASLSARTLARVAVCAAVPGFAMSAYSGYLMLGGVDPMFFFAVNSSINMISATLIATAYAAGIALAVRLGALGWASRAISSVGRMAFTNYIMQTVLACLIFYKPGLELYGELSRLEQWGVVLGVWGVQIAFSVWYMRVFAMGPLEWFWRSLTYWRLAPLPRAAGANAG